jgi:two-component system CheB/CheR fusion protein
MKPRPNTRKAILFHQKAIKDKSFPIVAIGASTGGLEAVTVLLKNLPADTGMAFIYVQHLSPDHKSSLPTILSRITAMKVQEIEDMEHMAPDNVYVIPHNKEIKVTDGHIQLLPRRRNIPSNFTIDVLFSSLAETHKENVIGVVLSGNAKDGTLGLKAIKNAGGVTFAQDGSAKAGSMPESAIASGMVDFILSPREIARTLARFSKNGYVGNIKAKTDISGLTVVDPVWETIFEMLYKETGVDFSHYKMSTIKRRLRNRMLQSGVQTIKEYEVLLRKNSREINILRKDLLINVTDFFRDTETFLYLKNNFLPRLLKGKMPGETLRLWVPATSTGQEAYSIAMLLNELQENTVNKIPVKIFATDLSDQAIQVARAGKYSSNDIKAISKSRLKRFFTKTGDSYYIVKELRDMCVFAAHNILHDPPFFRIDLISCRNLLVYLDTAAQKKVLAILHFALNDGKSLLLGKSETIGVSSLLYSQTNNNFKIFSRKKSVGIRKMPELTSRFAAKAIYEKAMSPAFKKNANTHAPELEKAIDAMLLSRYVPACAIINKDMEILQFRGSTALYLTHPQGKASLNILKMTHPECALELRDAIQTAIQTKQAVRKTGIEIKMGTTVHVMCLEVCPLKIDWEEPLLLVVFTLEEAAGKTIENGGSITNNALRENIQIKKLTAELDMAREQIHMIMESQEKAYEELQTANEEIVSANEEFQTLNEELETSKEEIEATNEELLSAIRELKTHNELLAESYSYSQTIIATIHEPMIVLDKNLHVKSANKSFYKKFLVNKQETEGKPLFELGNKQWDIPELRELLEEILSKNSHFENFEVTHLFPDVGEKVMLLNASRIIQKTHREKLILLAIEDITERARYYIKEKELFKKDISIHQADKAELEIAVTQRTKQLYDKNIELENANKELVSFTYISSHDLQEPLRKIQNFVACMLDEETKNLSLTGKVYLEKTYDTAKQMRALIEDLLTYSRAKDGAKHFERMDIRVIVGEIKEDLKEFLLEKKAVIRIAGLCEANIVRFQFRQLLHNLISNSIKFSKPGIQLRATINCAIVKGNKLKNEKPALPANELPTKIDYCHITYSDNGIGFDPQYNERIFEVFQRLHSTQEYKGTGMGLAICKRIVENHNGIIMANGQLNKGARFDIYLPA